MNALRFPDWQKPCELALLEPDPEKLFQRVIVAETAIYRRLRDSTSSPETVELEAIAGMLKNLRCLIAHTFVLSESEEKAATESLQISDNRSKDKRERKQNQPFA
jgi:hypothetical protein